jgi:acyl carrier protein
VNRAALPAPDANNILQREEITSMPRTTVEERLVEIVVPLLSLEQVGIDDNFFLLGGNSMMGTQLIMRVAVTFGIDLSLRTLFEMPTVRQLAAEIERLIVVRVEAMSEDEALGLLQ